MLIIMKLSDLCTIKTNFPDADFWIGRRGTIHAVGSVTKTFNPEHIGVKVVRDGVVSPTYLFYVLPYICSTGKFKPLATGTLSLVNIKVQDVKNIQVAERTVL